MNKPNVARRRIDTRIKDLWESRGGYLAYLQSAIWQQKRLQVIYRAGGLCERCRQQRASEVHHLTYDRLYQEPLSDLQALCHACHDEVEYERIQKRSNYSYK